MKITNIFKCSQKEFDNSKSRDLITLNCTMCNMTYKRSKKNILDTFTRHNIYPKYCSQKCSANFKKQQATIETICCNCNKPIIKLLNQSLKYSKNFCSNSCKGSFINKNKTKGIRRSKLEIYLEEKLTELYPTFEILYSNKTTIGSELDIYIPSLKLAFEVQGIFHYEPIYGQEKLEQIQKNDKLKKETCLSKEIDLVLIDISKLKRCTVNTVTPYNTQVMNTINTRLPTHGFMSSA